jgi:serine/threonine-protein kinase
VALDQFKTQVLLLHSEQSTLDTLSAGFDDRYTVHCATSGSEALTTLGDTPINVIVSAQDLPGMSGLEALREAKKRSPETIGILLAGAETQGLEALVGIDQVFEIVRGNVTPDAIKKLVDSATQQVRLLALAESANDMAANPDEPAQHIVMETSENGSTRVSDGTARFRALDPEQLSAAAASGARSVDILALTRDDEFLKSIKDSARGMHTVHYANTLKLADEAIRKHKVGVVVVDAAMVGSKVEKLTEHLRRGSDRLVAVVAGRRDDGDMLMDLINRGKVYRFLLKPVSPGRARLAIEASIKHHLEAPEAAFKIKGMRAGTPASVPVAKAQPTPQAVATAQPAATDAQAETPAVENDSQAAASPKPVEVDSRKQVSAHGSKSDSSPGLGSSARSGGWDFSRFGQPKLIAIAAAAVVTVATALFWFAGNSDNLPSVTDVSSATSMAEDDVLFDAPAPDAMALLDEARMARDAGQIFSPTGANAIEFYTAAANADIGNVTITAELTAVIDEALGMAETALLEMRVDDASAALDRVALADPENARLPFLGAQLSQVQVLGLLDEARAAIRDTRFEDAANALAAAQALNPVDMGAIDAVADELSAVRSQQQVDEVLALANARLEEGDLLSPANDNARYYYDLVLENDANNTAARQGLSVIASKLVLQARTEIDNGNLDVAENLLVNARSVDAASDDLNATNIALAAARDEVVTRQQRAAELRRQQEADRQAAARKAEAERIAAAQAAAEEAQQAETVAAAAAAVDTQASETTQPEVVAADNTVDDAAGSDNSIEETVAEPAPISSQTPVSISSLTRTKYVAPKYPRAAQRRGDSGWVDLHFTVSIDGSVKDAIVSKSKPEGTFDEAAVRAVEKWAFEPVVENGEAVEKRAGVRMMFAAE